MEGRHTGDHFMESIKPDFAIKKIGEDLDRAALKEAKKDPKKKSHWKIKAFAIAILIAATIYGATRPPVALFLNTLKIYSSRNLQHKAWNEAQRQYLEGQIKNSQQQLESVKPQSFYIPEIVQVAKAAELPAKPRPALNEKVQAYLESKNSPLARYTDLILEQKNWQRIISISFAESSMCLKVDPNKPTNCWGIGGAKLWNLGNTFEEAIPKVENFLETQPGSSKVKYQTMTIQQMNGVWNQPKTTTWIGNNAQVLEDLSKFQ